METILTTALRTLWSLICRSCALRRLVVVGIVAAVLLPGMLSVQAAGRQMLRGQVPQAVSRLTPEGRPAGTESLRLAIGLPLRNQAELEELIRQLSDPSSPRYRRYLTPAQFTERFGPTQQDCQAVVAFAKANGLSVTGVHPNRLIVDVVGKVSAIEKAFHMTMRTYRHPEEGRKFYAPDSNPALDLGVTIQHVSGLDNYSLPRPNYKIKTTSKTQSTALAARAATPQGGSGQSGTYGGNDFRAAYAPGTALTGAGQSIGLVQFDGYHTSDIDAYRAEFGLPDVPLINVPINGGVNVPGTNNAEVCLDIEMALAMAPGISAVYVYIAPNPSPWVDILSRIANDNLVRQVSCSWSGGDPDPTSEAIFQQMAAQGQSFFCASGDSDAFTDTIPFPGDSPHITLVGGTTLTTNGPGGAYTSETVWNWGSDTGSSGGISPNYAIPDYQQGVPMTANQGSTIRRNVPDVAMAADNIYVTYDNGSWGGFGGTSCAAPLWAGFMALVNQQTVANGQAPIGFFNPALYAIGLGGSYHSNFHDTTTGNNFNNSSPVRYAAVTGYDLCTGWGSPSGTALVNTLAGAPVSGGVPVLSAPSNQTATSGLTFSYQIVASQNPQSYSAAGLPAGVSVNTVTGLIRGIPTGSGTTTASIQATNAYGTASGSLVITVVIPPPPEIQSALDVTGTLGSSFSYQIAATNNPTRFDADDLPTGLSVDSMTGVISGTPTVAGVTPVTISATNAGGIDSKTLTLTLVSPSVPVITGGVTLLTEFTGDNGENPYGALVQGIDGNFYGTTHGGGGAGQGTVFKTTPNGTLTTLASFAGANGANPYAGLIQGGDGNFYGTTYGGGSAGLGTVFKLTPDGTLTTLVSFAGTNGANPYAGLIQGSDGNFYGTTYGGGSAGLGTVFKLTPDGTLTTLVSFAGTNGANPYAGLIQGSDGNFYGTTYGGGSAGLGTVFKLTPDGTLTTLASFTGANGANPYAGLIQGSDGNFYGTTTGGGTNSGGTVFQITADGTVATVYSFHLNDGSYPYAGLLQGGDGNFYGTTLAGGAYSKGVAYKLTPGGVFTPLYSFSHDNGARPYAGLILGRDGNLYGTAIQGGSHDAGTLFILTPHFALAHLSSWFSYQIVATGDPFLYDASDLPFGLSVDTKTGQISGSPWVTGTFTVTLSATNAGGTGSTPLVIDVLLPTPGITSALNAAGTYGVPFTYQITATNDPARFSASGLPSGLSVNTATGAISGTPTASGLFSVLLSATNTGGTSSTVLTLTVQSPYAVWKTGYFGADAPDSLAGDTVVNNTAGISNLMAYALGMNPFTAKLNGLPVPGQASVSGLNYLTLNFVRNSSATEITYVVEASDDLSSGGWEAICTFRGGVWSPASNVTESGGDPSYKVEVRDVQAMDSAPRRFLRLKVSH